MDKITARELRREKLTSLCDKLPVGVTLDGEVVVVMLKVGQYNELVRRYNQVVTQAKDTQGVTDRKKLYDAIKW